MTETINGPAGSGRLDKDRRQARMDLRELHKLYGKHEAQDILHIHGGCPVIARCACGKLLIYESMQHLPMWRPASHADKRTMKKRAAVRAWLKGLPYE